MRERRTRSPTVESAPKNRTAASVSGSAAAKVAGSRPPKASCSLRPARFRRPRSSTALRPTPRHSSPRTFSARRSSRRFRARRWAKSSKVAMVTNSGVLEAWRLCSSRPGSPCAKQHSGLRTLPALKAARSAKSASATYSGGAGASRTFCRPVCRWRPSHPTRPCRRRSSSRLEMSSSALSSSLLRPSSPPPRMRWSKQDRHPTDLGIGSRSLPVRWQRVSACRMNAPNGLSGVASPTSSCRPSTRRPVSRHPPRSSTRSRLAASRCRTRRLQRGPRHRDRTL